MDSTSKQQQQQQQQLIFPEMDNDWDLEDAFQKMISDFPPLENLFEPACLLPLVPNDKNSTTDHELFKNNTIGTDTSDIDKVFAEHNLISWYHQEIMEVKPMNSTTAAPLMNASLSSVQKLDNNVVRDEVMMMSECASSSMKEDEDQEVVTNKKMSCSGIRKRPVGAVGLELEEIQKHFNKPITQAAKEMKVGLTVLKKRCRELHIMRWPHRKIKSLNSLINNVKELGLSEETWMLEEHKRVIEKLPDFELTERTKKLRQACFKANYKKRRLLALAAAAYS